MDEKIKEKLIMHSDAPEGQRQSHITEQINWQKQNVDELEKRLQELKERMKPVLKSESIISVDKENSEAERSLVPLAESLKDINKRLVVMTTLVGSLLNSCEL